MKKWNYFNEETDVRDIYTQNAWNQTLISSIHQMKGSLMNNNDVILVSYVLKDLMETLLWIKSDKPIIKYRYDNEHTIYFNDIKLRIENYEYDHQKNEEWIESQKNVYLNLDSNPIPELYPEVWKNRETIRNHFNGKFTSGRVINNNDIIYVGILTNRITNVGSVVYFHIDELKSKDRIYEYAISNNKNISLHPELSPSKLENDNMIEFQYYNDMYYSAGEFTFYPSEEVISHAHSFRKYKMMKFAFPVLIDLPINGDVNSNDIYEFIGETLKTDFINYLKTNKPK